MIIGRVKTKVKWTKSENTKSAPCLQRLRGHSVQPRAPDRPARGRQHLPPTLPGTELSQGWWPAGHPSEVMTDELLRLSVHIHWSKDFRSPATSCKKVNFQTFHF